MFSAEDGGNSTQYIKCTLEREREREREYLAPFVSEVEFNLIVD